MSKFIAEQLEPLAGDRIVLIHKGKEEEVILNDVRKNVVLVSFVKPTGITRKYIRLDDDNYDFKQKQHE